MNFRLICLFFLLSLTGLVVSSCNQTPAEPSPPPISAQETSLPASTLTSNETAIAEQVTPPATPEPPATPPLPLVVLLASPDADPAQASAIESVMADLAAADDLGFEVHAALSQANLHPAMRLVVVLPPASNLADLVAAAPNTQFLAIGITDLETAENLTVLGSGGTRPDQLGFLAGYLAATITSEWRVGVISLGNLPSENAARQGFLNGVVFFCGLCRQTYPPFLNYPMYFELPADAGQAEWQALTDELKQKSVQTVFVAPGVGEEGMVTTLAQAGINLIGVEPPPAAIRDQWVASIHPSYPDSLRAIWPNLMAGQSAANLPAKLEISDVNPELLSPGRQQLVQSFLADLAGGFIDTGVDPLTGIPNGE